MSATSETPRAVQETCPPCRGLGVLSHGAPYETSCDRCDRCGGAGLVTRRVCTVELLTGVPCGERVMRTAVRFDDASETWGCLNGHRFDVRPVAGAWRWTRIEDHARAGEAMAS